VQLGLLEDQRDEIIAEWSRLQLEQAWLADASHVENKAREQLGMELPEKSLILVVKQP
jgi:cell division protein FtsL